MLTSSFTGKTNYMRDLGELMADRRGDEALRQHDGGVGLPRAQADPDARGPGRAARDPLGAAAAARLRLHDARRSTSKLWLVEQQADGTFAATAVADIGDPKKMPLPVDISLSADDRFLFVDTFMDGTCRVYDVCDPQQAEARARRRRSARR